MDDPFAPNCAASCECADCCLRVAAYEALHGDDPADLGRADDADARIDEGEWPEEDIDDDQGAFDGARD